MTVQYIAEIGNNHNGDISLAKKMVDAAVKAKADFVKFQVYNVDKFVTKRNIYYDEFIFEKLNFDEFRALKRYTDSKKGKFLATPFDEDSLNLLDEMGLKKIKIASGDMNNWQLLERAVMLNMELMISVGGATLDEIDQTVDFLNKKKGKFSILHCISKYPAEFSDLNLRFIKSIKDRYSVPIGFSDHSKGIEASLGAIALDAEIIEKHFTTDSSLPGGDNEMSVLPEEFNRLVIEGNHILESLGTGNRIVSNGEKEIREVIRRKIYAKNNINAGDILKSDDIILLRPDSYNAGLDSNHYPNILGKRLKLNIKKGDLLTMDMING